MQMQFLDIYRTGLKTTADVMKQQLDAVHNALDEQVRTVREFADVKSMDELVALQTRLTGAQMERAMEFWTQMWRAVGESNRSSVASTIATSTSMASAVRDAAQQETRKHQERKTA